VNLAAFDLNLLVAFEALFAERSVTRAALRLGLSQPATSHVLARLRAGLDDPLFVRTPAGLVPTSRAEALAVPIEETLDRLRAALRAGLPFDAARERRSYTIAAADLAQLLLLPALAARIAKTAPSIELVVKPVAPDEVERRLADGSLDASIGVSRAIEDSLEHAHLLDERLVSVTARGHALLRARGSAEAKIAAWCGARHLRVVPSGDPVSRVDRRLEALRRTRHVVVTVQQFFTAPHLVACSDLVWTAPARMAAVYARRLPLSVRPLPFTVEPFHLQLSWHPRRAKDPAQAWLREQIVAVSRAL